VAQIELMSLFRET